MCAEVCRCEKGTAQLVKMMAAELAPFGSHLGYRIDTLRSYSTPYFYAVGPSPLGSVQHFQTIKRLKNYMNRLVKAGKLSAKVTP
jgi:hypothetical protein